MAKRIKKTTNDREREYAELKARVEAGRATEAEVLDYAHHVRRSADSRDAGEREFDRVLKDGLTRFPDSPALMVAFARGRVDRPPDEAMLMQAIGIYESRGEFESADSAAHDLATDIFGAGLELWEMGDDQGARKHFQRALKIYPWHADAHVHLGIMEEKAGRWQEAARLYFRAAQFGRMYCHAMEARRWRETRQMTHEAMRHVQYRFEIETRPFLRGLFNLSLLYYRRQRFDLVLRYAEELIDHNPSDNSGARFHAYSVARFQHNTEWLRRLEGLYGARNLGPETDELEKHVFGDTLANKAKKV